MFSGIIYDKLKSISKGYASFDYEISDYRRSNLVKLDVLLNGDGIDALSFIIHSEKAYGKARKIAEKLNTSPRQIERLLSELKKNGTIQHIGSNKSGEWKVL